MPIQIRELVIRTTVTGGEESSAPSSATASGGVPSGDARAALIAECVEQVMEILREERER